MIYVWAIQRVEDAAKWEAHLSDPIPGRRLRGDAEQRIAQEELDQLRGLI